MSQLKSRAFEFIVNLDPAIVFLGLMDRQDFGGEELPLPEEQVECVCYLWRAYYH